MQCLKILGSHRCLIHVPKQICFYSQCQSLLAKITLMQTLVAAPTSLRSNIFVTCQVWTWSSAVLWPLPVFIAGHWVLAVEVRFTWNYDNFLWALSNSWNKCFGEGNALLFSVASKSTKKNKGNVNIAQLRSAVPNVFPNPVWKQFLWLVGVNKLLAIGI